MINLVFMEILYLMNLFEHKSTPIYNQLVDLKMDEYILKAARDAMGHPQLI